MQIYLHYIGSHLYGKEKFLKEVETYGINRCIPLPILKTLKWGDRILLATFTPKPLPPAESGAELDQRKNKKGGTAEIFGYFDIRNVNLQASPEFKQTLLSRLNVVESTNINQTVNRQCGSYVLASQHFITDDLSSLVEKAILLSEETGEHIKFFAGGEFTELFDTIENINFTRTVIKIDLNKDLSNAKEVDHPLLGMIENYSKRTYIKRYAKRGRPPRKETTNESQGS